MRAFPRSRALGALGILTSLFLTTPTNAQALKAKQLKVDLVQAYNQCTAPTVTHRPSLAFPACTPVWSTTNNPANVYYFGPKGKMSVHLKRGTGDIKIKIKGTDIYKNGVPHNGTDLTLSALLRWTDTGCGAGFNVPCTVVDFPFPFGITCNSGKCTAVASTFNTALPGSVYIGDTLNLEVGQIEVVDEDGDDVFRMGLLVP